MVSFKRMVRIAENDENFSIVNLIFKVFVFCSVMLNKLIIKCVRSCWLSIGFIDRGFRIYTLWYKLSVIKF